MATTTHKKTSKDTAAASKVKSDKSVSKKQYVVNGFSFTSEKTDDGWYVGQLLEHPEVISQGKSLKELIANLMDAFNLVMEVKEDAISPKKSTKITSKSQTVIRKKRGLSGLLKGKIIELDSEDIFNLNF